mmetsp:Transcript_12534/g.26413  ORF Transcript_12534/g.26413 Transcript_12534/m.26413 type:complete len:204 (+) Transcript_12534:3700-4311(+)
MSPSEVTRAVERDTHTLMVNMVVTKTSMYQYVSAHSMSLKPKSSGDQMKLYSVTSVTAHCHAPVSQVAGRIRLSCTSFWFTSFCRRSWKSWCLWMADWMWNQAICFEPVRSKAASNMATASFVDANGASLSTVFRKSATRSGLIGHCDSVSPNASWNDSFSFFSANSPGVTKASRMYHHSSSLESTPPPSRVHHFCSRSSRSR